MTDPLDYAASYGARRRATAAAARNGDGHYRPNLDADAPPEYTTDLSSGEAPPADPAPREPPLSSWPVPIPLGTTPSVPEFPIQVFPGPIAKLVEESAWAMNCPMDFVGVPILTLAGGAMGNSRHVAITPTHTQPPLI